MITLADYERLDATTADGLWLLNEETRSQIKVNQGGYEPGRYKRKDSLFDQPADN